MSNSNSAKLDATSLRWNLIIDIERCENCNNCVLANKDEFVGNEFPGYSAPQELHGDGTIKVHRRVRGEGHMVDAHYLPAMCNHCDDAPCIKKAGTDVIKKRADGIVMIDPVKAKGRRDLVDSCPYGAIVWNEEQQLPQNWIFDAHLLDQGWKEPRCAQSCPTDAIRAAKTDAAGMMKLVEEQRLEVRNPELKTWPRVYYRNLHLYAKDFVGGSVVVSINGTRECVADAHATLSLSNRVLQETQTDSFGDFKFDGLDATQGRYLIRITHPTFGKASIEAPTGQTRALGEIELPNFTGQPPQRPRRRRDESSGLTGKDQEPMAVATPAGAAM